MAQASRRHSAKSWTETGCGGADLLSWRSAPGRGPLFTQRRGTWFLGRIDHLGLPYDYRAQNFLLLRLGHIEVVERTADLRSNLVELFRSDMEVVVGFAQLPARVVKGPPVAAQIQRVRMNLRRGKLPFSLYSFRAGFTLSLGFVTIWSLKRSTTKAMASTPPRRS